MAAEGNAERFAAVNEEGRATTSSSRGADDPIEPCASHQEKIWVRVSIRDYGNRPLLNREYELEVDGVVYEGDTGDRGWVEQKVPATAKQGTLTLWLAGPDEEPEVVAVEINAMDPLDVDSGVQARLENLEFSQTEDGSDFAEALGDFRAWSGLALPGALDGEARALLGEIYDPDSTKSRPQPPLPVEPEE